MIFEHLVRCEISKVRCYHILESILSKRRATFDAKKMVKFIEVQPKFSQKNILAKIISVIPVMFLATNY